MADSQILNASTADAQSVYELPGTVRFILKAVNADFSDNGAGSSWIPAVVIGSDSGHVIARALDPSVVVAAGDDAAVSWFPGVKAGGAASPTTSFPWIRRRKLGAVDQTIGSNLEPLITWNSTHNDFPAVFTAGVDGIQVLVDGLYAITVHLFLNGPIGNFPFEIYLNNVDSDDAFRYSAPAQFPLYSGVAVADLVARLTAGHDVYVTCRQESGFPWTIAGNDGCWFEVRRLGDATVVDSFG